MSIFDRIILGTANFSKEYNGTTVKDVDAILAYCKKIGVYAIDTAVAYGTHRLEYPKYIKIRKDDFVFDVDSNDVLLAHGPDAYERVISISNEKNCLYGASVYDDEDIKKIGEYTAYAPYVIQLPYSLYDRRNEKWLPFFNTNRIQVIARSVFLRGKILERFTSFEALSFVLMNPLIHKVIIGTDSLQMLQDTLGPFVRMDNAEIEEETVIDPRKWHVEKTN